MNLGLNNSKIWCPDVENWKPCKLTIKAIKTLKYQHSKTIAGERVHIFTLTEDDKTVYILRPVIVEYLDFATAKHDEQPVWEYHCLQTWSLFNFEQKLWELILHKLAA